MELVAGLWRLADRKIQCAFLFFIRSEVKILYDFCSRSVVLWQPSLYERYILYATLHYRMNIVQRKYLIQLCYIIRNPVFLSSQVIQRLVQLRQLVP